MSHELRTPLNSLLILSKMLSENRDGNLTEEQVKFASTVYTSGTELLALINEVLDLSKVEAGKMPIEPREAPLSEVRDYLEQNFRHVAAHRALSFEVRVAPGLPERLHTDVVRLEQILKNLLSNAFKFTERGSVIVTVSPAAGHPGMLAFAVQDTGIGIPMEKQALIFEAFQQADGTTSRRYGGTGLGLTISREIARLLGGSLSVESTPGAGSTFTLRVPLRYAGPEASRDPDLTLASVEGAEAYPALPTGLDLTGRTVLLADDDVRNLFAINSVLESAHMKVIHAHDGREALRVLEDSPRVDLVLMDTMMPGLDGLSAIRAIRAQPRWRGLPIVSLTAKAMKGDRESALAAGASDYVAKPVDPERLLSVVHRWICGEATPSPERGEPGGEVWN
jgi:CheY-like chemotaxis protein